MILALNLITNNFISVNRCYSGLPRVIKQVTSAKLFY